MLTVLTMMYAATMVVERETPALLAGSAINNWII
jgi:hypothetical protein